MVLRNMGDSSAELSMKFRDMSDDVVYFDASASDKEALLEFLDASIADIDRNRVEMSTMGASIDTLEEMHDTISAQIGSNAPVAMRRALFADMAQAARAWKSFGFDMASPEEHDELGVSKQTVETVIAMHAESCDL